jgi:hypothetical protein
MECAGIFWKGESVNCLLVLRKQIYLFLFNHNISPHKEPATNLCKQNTETSLNIGI